MLGCDASPSEPPAPTLVGIAITPQQPSIVSGLTQQLAVTASYSNNSTRDVTSLATFEATGGTITSAGLFTAGNTPGSSFAISATFEGKGATTAVTVLEPSVTGLALSPPGVGVQNATTRQFTATATYNNNTDRDVTLFATWTATGGTISSGGLFRAGNTPGAFEVQAAFGGRTATASGTVTIVVIAVRLDPSTATLLAAGTQQFAANALYSNGSSQVVTNTAVFAGTGGSFSSTTNGLYSGGNTTGAFQVSATLNGQIGTAAVNIVPPLTVSITGSPRLRGVSKPNGSYECLYEIRATGVGGLPEQFATWDGGRLDWRLNATGAVETDNLSAGQVTEYFGSNRVQSGSTVGSSAYASWSGPFSIIHTLRFLLPTGEIRTGSYTLFCD